ncbi:MAG: DNA polymerase III subunit gamma/tau [Clostridia bacterium]|nr:DNA polymerase III subunit gamma/tau [Clostridia bacterium]
MSYQALYRAWRPRTFSEICDQDAVVRTLRRQVETDRIAHAYLFCGTRGTGKTTAAKVLSRAINCLHPVNGDPCGECEICKALSGENCMDVLEIDAASNTGVDDIRELRDKIQYPPALTRYKVYIIDEVHMLSTGAFNALLKTLEEPPKHAVFILATTEPQKLPATILSRCQRFDFHRIRVEAIVSRLKVVLAGIGRSADMEALLEIARAAEGAMRDALSLLDVCLSFTEDAVTAELARDVLGTTGRDFMFEFADALIAYDAAAALGMIDDAMRRGSDPRVFSLDAANHLRGVLLAAVAGDQLDRILEITPEDAQRFREQAGHASWEQLMRAMELFMRVESEMKWATQPRTILELAAVRACHPEQEEESDLRERLDRMEKRIENGAVAAPAPKTTPAAEKKPDAPKKPSPAAKVSAPAAAPPPEYLAGIEKFAAENGSVKRMLEKMQFAGIEDGVVTVSFGKDGIMVRRVLEAKQGLIEAALSESFGTPMRLRMVNEGQTAQAKPSAAAKSVIEQSYDVFGRDKIDLTD